MRWFVSSRTVCVPDLPSFCAQQVSLGERTSEKLIQETLREMRGEITTIIIAHRLSTVMNADKLLVIQDGEIVEQGSPTQLIKQEAGYFSRLWTAQSS